MLTVQVMADLEKRGGKKETKETKPSWNVNVDMHSFFTFYLAWQL